MKDRQIVLHWERSSHNFHVYTYDVGGNKPFSFYIPKLWFDSFTSPLRELQLTLGEKYLSPIVQNLQGEE